VVLKYAQKWYRSLESNPAEGVTLPKLRPKSKPWALTVSEAGQLLGAIGDQPKAHAAVWLLLVNGLRRGELLALRWGSVDEDRRELSITEAYYRGHLDTPKTEASVRTVPLDAFAIARLGRWKRQSRRTAPSDLIFGTRNGKPESSNNLLHRHVFPACDRLGIRRATYLTFRRTFSTWSSYNAVPAKDIAEMMGHAEVNMQLTYIQTMDTAKRAAVEKIATELARIGQISDLGEKSVVVN
jgi:integrase